MKCGQHFFQKLIRTTWKCCPHFIRRKRRQQFLQIMIQTTWKCCPHFIRIKCGQHFKLRNNADKYLLWSICISTIAFEFLKICQPKVETLQFVPSNFCWLLQVFCISLQKQAKVAFYKLQYFNFWLMNFQKLKGRMRAHSEPKVSQFSQHTTFFTKGKV